MKPISITFKVEFITPLLLGGAGKDSCDPLSLGKALRGGWRFWFRAVCGGVLQGNKDIRIKVLQQLEDEIFGSTGKATFKLLALPLSSEIKEFPRCPHKDTYGKKAYRKGLIEGTQFEIRILPRKGFDCCKGIGALKAVIWLWANLGSSGNRSRRGFGSPFLLAEQGVFPEGLPILMKTQFENRDDIVKHLNTGIAKACTLIYEFIVKMNISNSSLIIDAIPIKQYTDFFVLRGLEQIMVGDNLLGDSLVGAIDRIHGKSTNHEIGKANPRYASPVYVRLHKVGNGYIPVATWSRQLGISTGGTSPNTALDYIRTGVTATQDILENPL